MRSLRHCIPALYANERRMRTWRGLPVDGVANGRRGHGRRPNGPGVAPLDADTRPGFGFGCDPLEPHRCPQSGRRVEYDLFRPHTENTKWLKRGFGLAGSHPSIRRETPRQKLRHHRRSRIEPRLPRPSPKGETTDARKKTAGPGQRPRTTRAGRGANRYPQAARPTRMNRTDVLGKGVTTSNSTGGRLLWLASNPLPRAVYQLVRNEEIMLR